MSVPPRLGRGLAALLAEDRDIASASLLATEALAPGPFQPRVRMTAESLSELTDSIRRQGVLQPLLVRPDPARQGAYQIIAGERRWRASRAAGLREVPVLIRALTDVEAMAAALVENLQRDDLNPIEEAEGYRRLMKEFKLTQDEMADTVAKSRSHIANMLRLLQVTGEVRRGVEAGLLSAGHARALLNHPKPDQGAKAVIKGGLSVRQTEVLAQRGLVPPRTRRPRGKLNSDERETKALARSISEHLGLRVEITWDGRGGTVLVRYQELDQLEAVCALLLDKPRDR